jgi:hypothetical protein
LNEINIYCDESCHLENDRQKAMVLGAIWTPKEYSQKTFSEIREIKIKNKLSANFEIKWNKISESKVDFYLNLVNYFFSNNNLHFRALVVHDKSILDHETRNQTHDDFYYKMYFDLLKVVLEPKFSYYIYLDIKDTKSQQKVQKLKEVLRASHYDFSKDIIKRVQQVRSHEIELIQLTDILIGAFSYLHRGLNINKGKLKVIEEIKRLSGYSLMNSTLFKENKCNIFIWKGSGRIKSNA